MSHDISINLQLACYAIVGVVSVLSNCLIFIVIGFTPKLHTITNLFLLSLASTDVLIVLIGVPIQLVNLEQEGGLVTNGIDCQIHGLLILVTFLTSNFNLTLIAVHRYVLVVRNAQYKILFSRYRIILAIASLWVVSFTIGIPPLVGWGRYGYNHDRAHCMVDWEYSQEYVVFLQILAYPIPLCVMCYCYYKVFQQSYMSRKRLASVTDKQNFSQKKNELRLTKMCLLVLLCFFVLFLPYAILVVMEGYLDTRPPHVYSFIAMLMAYSNSMFDFWIYAGMSTRFRKSLKSISQNVISRVTCRSVQVHQFETSADQGVEVSYATRRLSMLVTKQPLRKTSTIVTPHKFYQRRDSTCTHNDGIGKVNKVFTMT